MARAAELELLKSSLPRIEAFRSCDLFTLNNQNLKSNGCKRHDESGLHVNLLDCYVAGKSAPTITLRGKSRCWDPQPELSYADTLSCCKRSLSLTIRLLVSDWLNRFYPHPRVPRPIR